MPMSNYPNGFKDGVSIRGVPVVITHPGKVFWVSNASTLLYNQKGGSDSNDGSFNAPFSTLENAINSCVANRGDLIFIKPGHAETISSATALNFDTAGVGIVGLGFGTKRPTFTLDTATTTTIPVTAANIAVKNCIFTANFADIVSVFTLTTANYFTVEDCMIKETATNMNFLYVIDTGTTTADCDGLALLNNKWIEPDAATVSVCKVDGTNDNWQVKGNYFSVAAQSSGGSMFVIATGKVLTNVQVYENKCRFIGGDLAGAGVVFTTDGSTNSGAFANNYIQHTDTAGEIFGTASSGFSFFENRMSGVAGATGYVLPAVDS